jgi:hypothetical protein
MMTHLIQMPRPDRLEKNPPRLAALNGCAGGPHANTSLATKPDRALTASLIWSD